MAIWQKLGLRGKINLLLFLVLTVFLVTGLFWQYRQQRAILFADAVTKAKIIAAEATRSREYLSRQLKAGRVELDKDRYGLIPVVVANRVGELVSAFNAMGKELSAKTAQLEESEKRFRLLVETARDAIVAFLPSGQIFLVNRQAEKILGYSQQDLLGEPFDRLFMRERDVYPEGLTSHLSTATPQWLREVHWLKGLRQDKSQVRLELSVNIVDTGDRPFYTATLRERIFDGK